MTPHEMILTAAVALIVLVLVVGWLFHWYVRSAAWWPLVGREWRAHRSPFEADRDDEPDPEPDETGDIPQFDEDGDPYFADDDDEWVAELHHINERRHGIDRPIAQLTHYEVEAVIRDLGVPEWVPERLRAAA